MLSLPLDDTTKLATPRTCGLFFPAALLLRNQGRTNALDATTTQKKGDGVAKPPSLVFQHPKCPKIQKTFILPNMSAEIFCQNTMINIMKEIMNDVFPK